MVDLHGLAVRVFRSTPVAGRGFDPRPVQIEGNASESLSARNFWYIFKAARVKKILAGRNETRESSAAPNSKCIHHSIKNPLVILHPYIEADNFSQALLRVSWGDVS